LSQVGFCFFIIPPASKAICIRGSEQTMRQGTIFLLQLLGKSIKLIEIARNAYALTITYSKLSRAFNIPLFVALGKTLS